MFDEHTCCDLVLIIAQHCQVCSHSQLQIRINKLINEHPSKGTSHPSFLPESGLRSDTLQSPRGPTAGDRQVMNLYAIVFFSNISFKMLQVAPVLLVPATHQSMGQPALLPILQPVDQ